MDPDRVEMRLYASLRKWKPAPVSECALPAAATVRGLLRENGIPEEEVAIIVLNGKRGSLDSALRRGDTVSLFPLIGGGWPTAAVSPRAGGSGEPGARRGYEKGRVCAILGQGIRR